MKVDVIDGNILAYFHYIYTKDACWLLDPPFPPRLDHLVNCRCKPVLCSLVVSSCLFIKMSHQAGTLKFVLQTPFWSYRSITGWLSPKKKITTCFAPQHLAILLWFSEEAFGCMLSNFRTLRLLHFHFSLYINKNFISTSVALSDLTLLFRSLFTKQVCIVRWI